MLFRTGVPVNFFISSNRVGEANQNFSNVAISASRNILMRFDANYVVSTTSADPQKPLNLVGGASGPQGIDFKEPYQGQQSWFHIVLFRQDIDPTCGTNIQAPNLASMNVGEITPTVLFNKDGNVQPIREGRRSF
jgi:hypothetical protein